MNIRLFGLMTAVFCHFRVAKARFDDFDTAYADRHPHAKLWNDCIWLVAGCICLVLSVTITVYCFCGPQLQFWNGFIAAHCIVASIFQIVYVQTDNRKTGYAALCLLASAARAGFKRS